MNPMRKISIVASLASVAVPNQAFGQQFDEAQHFLARMSSDMTEHVSACKTAVEFKVLAGKTVKDADGIIAPDATPAQIDCAKKIVPWLISTNEARKMGYP